MGGAALHLGNIAEMKTGEGKTLVATLPTYLNALTGDGVHVVTVNDYLAKYHAEWMGRIYHFLGLTIGMVLPEMTPVERRVSYARGHHLRHQQRVRLRLPARQHGQLARGVRTARAPLRDRRRGRLDPHRRGPDAADHLRPVGRVRQVVRRVRQPRRAAAQRDRLRGRREEAHGRGPRGRHRPVEDHLGIDNLYDAVNTPLISFLNNAIKAKELFRRDRDYVVIEGEVLIVDEHTGRMLHGRRYNEGLHQAIEAKEKVEIREEYQTLATITLQNYFRLYEKLGRHDRYGDDRGVGVRQDLQARRGPDPDQQADGRASTSPTWSTAPRTPSTTRSSTTSPSGTPMASRCSSAPSRWRSPSGCQVC